MKTRYEIHKGQFNGSQKIQYYIWDSNMKRTVVYILHGGIRAAKAIRKVLTIITLALLLTGCVRVKFPDGTEYLRIGPQQIDGAIVKFPDGSELLFKGQKAELPPVKITTTSITIGREKVGQ